MTWTGAAVIFIIIWWVVLFAVLPLGVSDRADPVTPGHAQGAPNRPRILYKSLLTTAISIALWLVVYFVITADLVSFRA